MRYVHDHHLACGKLRGHARCAPRVSPWGGTGRRWPPPAPGPDHRGRGCRTPSWRCGGRVCCSGNHRWDRSPVVHMVGHVDGAQPLLQVVHVRGEVGVLGDLPANGAHGAGADLLEDEAEGIQQVRSSGTRRRPSGGRCRTRPGCAAHGTCTTSIPPTMARMDWPTTWAFAKGLVVPWLGLGGRVFRSIVRAPRGSPYFH